MTSEWLVTLSPVLGLIVDVVLQIVCVHVTRRIGLSIIVGLAGGLLTALAVATVNLPPSVSLLESVAIWLFAIISFMGFEYNYWVFLNLNLTSLRIRTLRDLMSHSEGMSLANLMSQYSVEEMLDRRLERLQNGKQIVCVDGKYTLQSGKALLLIDRILSIMRAIILPANATK